MKIIDKIPTAKLPDVKKFISQRPPRIPNFINRRCKFGDDPRDYMTEEEITNAKRK